jgi:Domain of unknown function (DUF4190)
MEQQPPFPQPQPSSSAPAYGPVTAPVNVLAIVSLALGVASFALALGPLAGVPAIVTGYIARNQITQRGESGDQLALWGLVLGYVNAGLTAFMLVGVALAAVLFALVHH